MAESTDDDDSLNCSGELSEIVVRGNQLGKLRIRFPPCPPPREQRSKHKSSRPSSGDSVADSGIFEGGISSNSETTDTDIDRILKNLKKRRKTKRKEIKNLRHLNTHLKENAKEQWKARVKAEELMVEYQQHMNSSCSPSSQDKGQSANLLQQINALESEIKRLLIGKRNSDEKQKLLIADNLKLRKRNGLLLRNMIVPSVNLLDTWPPKEIGTLSGDRLPPVQ